MDSYSYSAAACQKLCLQQAVQAECSCSHPLLRSARLGLPPCNLTSLSKDGDCVLGRLRTLKVCTVCISLKYIF